MADELERPSREEDGQCIHPKSMRGNAGEEQHDRYGNQRYPERVTCAVDGMLMAAGVLRDPLLVSASAQHGWESYTGNQTRRIPGTQSRFDRIPVKPLKYFSLPVAAVPLWSRPQSSKTSSGKQQAHRNQRVGRMRRCAPD